jgi:signal transduction histidine kinase
VTGSPFTADLAELARRVARWAPTDDEGVSMRAAFERYVETATAEALRWAEREDTRRQESRQMEVALCHSDTAVAVVDRPGYIRLMNPAFAAIVAAPDAVGRPLAPFLVGGERFVAAIERGVSYQGEFAFTPPGGVARTVEATAVPIEDHLTGSATHHVITLKDVTDRVAAQREIDNVNRLMKSLVNLTPGIICALTPAGEWGLDNLSAKTLLADMGADARRRLSTLLLQAVGRRAEGGSRTVAVPLANGGVRWYSVQVETIPAACLIPGRVEGNLYLIAMTDVTALLRQEREIAARSKALAALSMEQAMAHDELANGLVFQIRQPVNVARAVGGRLAERASQRDCDGILESVATLARQIDAMDEALTSFTRRPSPVAADGACRLNDLLETVAILYASRAAVSGVSLRVEKGDHDVAVAMNETALLMIVVDLIENAFDAVIGKVDPVVRVVAGKVGPEATLTVEDNGDGVEEGIRLRLFEPFYTTRPDRKGLSLTLAMNVVNAVNGRIDVESAAPGARFRLSLPQATEGRP